MQESRRYFITWNCPLYHIIPLSIVWFNCHKYALRPYQTGKFPLGGEETKVLPAPFIVAGWDEKNYEIEYNFHTLVPN